MLDRRPRLYKWQLLDKWRLLLNRQLLRRQLLMFSLMLLLLLKRRQALNQRVLLALRSGVFCMIQAAKVKF
jgi:hypothetical protein